VLAALAKVSRQLESAKRAVWIMAAVGIAIALALVVEIGR
jgi:hypothetical protein